MTDKGRIGGSQYRLAASASAADTSASIIKPRMLAVLGQGRPIVDESLRDSKNWQFPRNCPTWSSGRIRRVERATFRTWFGSPVGSNLGRSRSFESADGH